MVKFEFDYMVVRRLHANLVGRLTKNLVSIGGGRQGGDFEPGNAANVERVAIVDSHVCLMIVQGGSLKGSWES